MAKRPTPTTGLTPRTTRAKPAKEKVKVGPGCLADDLNPAQTFTAVCRLESVRAPRPAAADDPVIFATAELQQKAAERTRQLAEIDRTFAIAAQALTVDIPEAVAAAAAVFDRGGPSGLQAADAEANARHLLAQLAAEIQRHNREPGGGGMAGGRKRRRPMRSRRGRPRLRALRARSPRAQKARPLCVRAAVGV